MIYPLLRAYPTNLSLDIVDQCLAVSNEYKYGYFRVGKAANSTILSTLYHMETGSSACDTITIQPLKDEYWLSCKSLSASIVNELKAYYKFTFVRNPGVRIASTYLDKIKRSKNTRRCLVNKRFSRELDRDVSFDLFLRYLEVGGLTENVHWAPQSVLVFEQDSNIDFVGKVESLEQDLRTVVKVIYGRSCDKILSVLDHKTESSQFVKSLSARQRLRIVDLYEADFSRFGYDIDMWIRSPAE